MSIYLAFYEAYNKQGELLFKKHIALDIIEPISNGDDFIAAAELDAFTEANGFNQDVMEVIIVGVAKL
ncbi:hypothetical protein PXW05_10500 [Serratia marcescens]|uniref:hypothetical protein n=1 Tax=Serratia marcescens TaxID=615 RepID=UPI0023AF2FDD|nr:hypothetical protein [Serratia marcescens]WEE06814.1 hypothetical protein PXW05_10500 [Serratia marcescens]